MPFGLPEPPPGWAQLPAGISLCMIVKNEERFLERCLASVADVVDEINIVDTGSTDRTIEIAKRFGARVEQREWRNDFGWARNEALKMATKRWILQLDADEEFVAESKADLRSIAVAPAHLKGVWIRCVNASDKYRGGGTVSHAIVRVFPNTERIRFHGAIHEFPSLDDASQTLDACNSSLKIVHHGYLNEVVDDRDKLARNMEIVEASVAREPEESFHWYNYGMTAFLGGDADRAIQGFERMWELCRKHGLRGFTPNGLQTLADVYTERKNQPEKGLEWAQECLKLAPRYANAHFSAGKALVELKRYDEARAMYECAIADGEFSDRQFIVDDEVPAWKAQCEIGSTYVAQADDVKALEWFERGLVNRPKVEPLRLNYAKALERLGRYPEAESAFRSVYDDFGGEQPALELVNYLLRRHKESEALGIIEAAYAKLPEAVAVQMLMAAAAVAPRNGADPVRYLTAARALAPRSADVANMLEKAYAQAGDRAAIERIRAEDSSWDPQTPAEFVRRFNILLAHQNYAKALEYALRGLEIDPRDARLNYSCAIAYANLGRKEEAIAAVEPITPADGDVYPLAAYLHAAVLREIGRTTEALTVLGQLLATDPKHVDGLQLYTDLLVRAGRLEEARNAAKLALA